MPDGSQQVRKGRKFNQVVAGATAIFLKDGFERASVDDIAREAAVSKATLYSYFPDKRLLFVEVCKQECQRHADEALKVLNFANPPHEFLGFAGRRLLDVLLSDFGQQMYRMSISESYHFHELGTEFYACGPGIVRAALIPYFEAAIGRGELAIDNLPLASDQFAELCKADVFARRVLNLQSQFAQAEVDLVINAAVDMFLARYGVRSSANGQDARQTTP